MKRIFIAVAAGLGLAALFGASSPQGCGMGDTRMSRTTASNKSSGSEGASGPRRFSAALRGFQETPAISTAGNGRFRAELSMDGTSLSWELSYADLEGGDPTAAHIHLGQRGVAGGVSVHLCGTGGRPACPASPATISGTASAAEVVGPAGQGLAAGEFEELLRAMRAGVTYVNAHNATFPSGEIRGQVRVGGEGGDDGEDDAEDD